MLEHGVRDWWTVDEEPLCLAYSPDGKHCAVGALDGHLKVFNAETGYSLKVALMDPKKPGPRPDPQSSGGNNGGNTNPTGNKDC